MDSVFDVPLSGQPRHLQVYLSELFFFFVSLFFFFFKKKFLLFLLFYFFFQGTLPSFDFRDQHLNRMKEVGIHVEAVGKCKERCVCEEWRGEREAERQTGSATERRGLFPPGCSLLCFASSLFLSSSSPSPGRYLLIIHALLYLLFTYTLACS